MYWDYVLGPLPFQAFTIVHNQGAKHVHTYIYVCVCVCVCVCVTFFPCFMWYYTCFVLFLLVFQFLGGLDMMHSLDLEIM